MGRVIQVVASILVASLAATAVAKPTIVFIAGIDSHGPGAHEFTAGCQLLASKLNDTGLASCTVVLEADWPATNDVFEETSLVVTLTFFGRWHKCDSSGCVARRLSSCILPSSRRVA